MMQAKFANPILAAMVLAVSATLATATFAIADETKESWQPPPPMPDDFDWVQMTSGEWLKGEIIAMYKDTLEFDSKEFDLQKLDWEDIAQIRSARIVQVAFENDTVATGKLLVDGDSVRVLGEADRTSSKADVLSITAGVPKERNYWSGKFGLGINLRTGNTEQRESNTNLAMTRRTPKNRIGINYLGNFSESDGTTIADNQRAAVDWNRFVSKRFYVTPVNGVYYRDPFQNIGSRYTLSVGAGYQIIDSSKIDWSVDAGIGYQKTSFDDVLEGELSSADTPAFSAGTRYDHELTGWMDYFFDLTFFVVNEESGSYTHHLFTGFEFEFFSDFDFDVSIVWDRIQDPRQNSDGTYPKKNDFRTIFGVSYSF